MLFFSNKQGVGRGIRNLYDSQKYHIDVFINVVLNYTVHFFFVMKCFVINLYQSSITISYDNGLVAQVVARVGFCT